MEKHAQMISTSEQVSAPGFQEASSRLDPRAAEHACAEERKRIAETLHETLAQMLFIIGMEAQWCIEHLSHDREAVQRLHKILHLAGCSRDELRCAIFDLRSRHSHSDNPLSGMLQQLVSEFQAQSGIAVTLSLAPQFPSLPPPVGDAVCRIIHESLFNVYKHAHASTVMVSLQSDDRTATVTVQDDGIGLSGSYSPEVNDSALHFGLTTMHEIAARAQGSLSIQDGHNRGVRVQARFPLLGGHR